MTEDEWDMVREAVNEFNSMSEDDRSGYYNQFFEDWDLTPDETTLFWELYDQAGG